MCHMEGWHFEFSIQFWDTLIQSPRGYILKVN